MEQDFPGTNIMIYDHNRDHVVTWAKSILGDAMTARYVAGTGTKYVKL